VRLLIDTTYRLRAPFSGTAVYTERLVEALRRSGEVEVVEAANNRRRPPAGGGWGSLRNLMADRRWTGRELPRLAAEAGAEVIHHPLPGYARSARVPQVITVHDLAFERLPDKFDPSFRRYATRVHRRAADRADVVICVSEATAQDVVDLWGVAAERIVVAPHGPGQELPAAQRSHHGDQYFLYVGDDEPRKNLVTLLAAHDRYRQAAGHPFPLVVAGSLDYSESGVLLERNPSRQRLAELYAGAVALIQPSLYEGFGLTALEAMSVGTPVIAASTPGLLEVCGDAAVYVDPSDPQALSVTMARIAADPELRRDLAQRGRQRAAGFSWAASAQAHLSAYSMALTQRPQ
jgi:glycosyltransferase involved in cell wall biosynthesis